MGFGRSVWADIDLSAIRHNMQQIMKHIQPGTLFCPIIKGDGYGHGAIPLAHEATSLGAQYIGVATLDEAISLRDAGIPLPTLILGYTSPSLAHNIVGNNLTQTIFRKDHADALSAAAQSQNKIVKVHIKIDTGMSRLGLEPKDAAEFCDYVSTLPHINLEGVFTHFSTADATDKTRARHQFLEFTKALDAIQEKNISIPLKHCANSAAILDMPETHLNMVRAGIILYGLWPSRNVSRPFSLKPAMHLKAQLSMVKTIPANQGVSYGATYVTKHATTVGTIPIGYADGYTRRLSGKAEVSIKGIRAPVIGTICMDQCMVDISHISNVKEGDEVLLFGGDLLPADELANHLGTINYEIVTMVRGRVPRRYTREI